MVVQEWFACRFPTGVRARFKPRKAGAGSMGGAALVCLNLLSTAVCCIALLTGSLFCECCSHKGVRATKAIYSGGWQTLTSFPTYLVSDRQTLALKLQGPYCNSLDRKLCQLWGRDRILASHTCCLIKLRRSPAPCLRRRLMTRKPRGERHGAFDADRWNMPWSGIKMAAKRLKNTRAPLSLGSSLRKGFSRVRPMPQACALPNLRRCVPGTPRCRTAGCPARP